MSSSSSNSNRSDSSCRSSSFSSNSRLTESIITYIFKFFIAEPFMT